MIQVYYRLHPFVKKTSWDFSYKINIIGARAYSHKIIIY